MLVQADGLNLLTDPIWSERASPLSWAGPKRYRPPGIAFEDLPPIDAVIISHNHYDHLNLPSLQRLQAAFDPLFIVPAGDDVVLRDHGIERVAALATSDAGRAVLTWSDPSGTLAAPGYPLNMWEDVGGR